MNNRQIGKTGEEIAAEYVRSQGVKILDINFYTKHGEIDLIFKDNNYLVFCEVKLRNNSLYGSSLEAVTYSKQKKIVNAAKVYMYVKKYSFDTPVRFDVIGIDDGCIKWIKSAF